MTATRLDVPHRLLDAHHPTVARREGTERRVDEDHLGGLLARAASLDLDDLPGWARLRADAHTVTTRLASQGHLPWSLHVDHQDPPVIVARTIAHAWRAVSLT